jgi:hypothetical protein
MRRIFLMAITPTPAKVQRRWRALLSPIITTSCHRFRARIMNRRQRP